MDLFVPLLWLASGICLFAGLQFSLFGLYRRKEEVYLAFGLLSMLLGIYMLFSTQWYHAESVDQAANIARVWMAIVCLIYPTFIWFLGRYIKDPHYPKFLLIIGAVYGLLFVVNIFSPYSFLYAELLFAEPIRLPWGEVVNNYETTMAPLAWLHYLATYSVFGWAIYRIVALWNKSNKFRSLSLIAYLSFQMLVVLHAELVDNLNIQSVYLGEFVFLFLVLIVSSTLAQEIRVRSATLEKTVNDLQEETELREEYETLLEYQAQHDYLTDLPNRRALLRKLNELVWENTEKNSKSAMLLFDLDNFKLINDSLGHDLGDKLLLEIAKRLQSIAAEDCFPVRLGGDEFALLCGGLSNNLEEAQKAAVLMAQDVNNEIVNPYHIDGHELTVSACIGVDVFGKKSDEQGDIIKQADMALYRAKSMGQGSVEVYAPSLKQEADRRLTIDKGLRVAIENDDIDVHFQPQVDFNNNLVGVEVLARWRHPALGDISPAEFVAVSEETGLIHALGEIVLRKACQHLKSWERKNLPVPSRISVNVSPWQLETAGFAKIIRGVLSDTGVDASRLNLEITESTFMREIKSILRKMNDLNELGITFSIDDFGTGYSALAWLKKLPLHELKIDRMFIHDMSVQRNDRFVETILGIARQMDLNVVAEGVETKSQRMALVAMGCECFQGYLISIPLPADKFADWMQEKQKTEAQLASD